MMRAAMLHRNASNLRVEDVPIPQPGDRESVVQVMAAGLCASDLHIIDGQNRLEEFPRVLGHEMAGVVAAVGRRSSRQLGDRVCVNFLITCGQCTYCEDERPSLCTSRKGLGVHRDGGFAEFVVVPDRNLIDIPANVKFSHAALATDALATPYHAILKRSHVQAGQSVAVIGLGGLGLNAVRLLKLIGADPIIGLDIDATSRERGTRAGAKKVLDPRSSGGITADIPPAIAPRTVLDFVGSAQTVKIGCSILARGGRIVIVGHDSSPVSALSSSIISREEMDIVGSYAFESAEISDLLGYMSRGELDVSDSITHTFQLEDIDSAVETLRTRSSSPSRIVIYPQNKVDKQRSMS